MKCIRVTAAVILEEGRIFAAERGYGSHQGWEFPGGKIRANETAEECLKREIREELSADIETDEFLMRLEHDYDDFHLSMDVFLCHVVNGRLILSEHKQAGWFAADELDDVAWLEADRKIIPVLKKRLAEIQTKEEV